MENSNIQAASTLPLSQYRSTQVVGNVCLSSAHLTRGKPVEICMGIFVSSSNSILRGFNLVWLGSEDTALGDEHYCPSAAIVTTFPACISHTLRFIGSWIRISARIRTTENTPSTISASKFVCVVSNWLHHTHIYSNIPYSGLPWHMLLYLRSCVATDSAYMKTHSASARLIEMDELDCQKYPFLNHSLETILDKVHRQRLVEWR